jgi:dynamin 1-like protein
MQAMAIVNERALAAKPTQVDPKTGKPLPARAQSPSLDTTGEAQNQSGFFGSFWASKNKKKMAAMEAPPPTLKASASLSERETSEVEVISKCRSVKSSCVAQRILIPLSELLITSYFNIVKRTMIDMVPKAIMYTLVQYVFLSLNLCHSHMLTPPIRFTKDEMQRELLENMYRNNELDDLLKESDYTIRRRKECQQMVESLGRASEIVSQVQ